MYVCLFIINPVGSMIQQNRQDKYSFDTDSLASLFLLTRSHGCPIVPPGQPDHWSTKGPSRITWHVHNDVRTSPAQRPNRDHRTNDTRSMAASVCRLHYRPRSHCSSATLPRLALQLDAPVVVLCNSTVPSSQLLLSTQANVSIVLYGLWLDRRCSPDGVATGYPTTA